MCLCHERLGPKVRRPRNDSSWKRWQVSRLKWWTEPSLIRHAAGTTWNLEPRLTTQPECVYHSTQMRLPLNPNASTLAKSNCLQTGFRPRYFQLTGMHQTAKLVGQPRLPTSKNGERHWVGVKPEENRAVRILPGLSWMRNAQTIYSQYLFSLCYAVFSWTSREC